MNLDEEIKETLETAEDNVSESSERPSGEVSSPEPQIINTRVEYEEWETTKDKELEDAFFEGDLEDIEEVEFGN